MSDWLPVTLAGQASAIGTYTSPGPVISYTSQGGTLVLAGTIGASVSGGLSAVSGLTSVTDSAGNTWQFSAANSQFPPSVYDSAGNGVVAFVAWCLNAQPVTSVTLADSTGHTDTWNVSLSEWSGIGWPDYGCGVQAPSGATTIPVGAVQVSTPGNLVVGALGSTTSLTSVTMPAGVTGFAGQTFLHSPVCYSIGQALTASPLTFIGASTLPVSGASSIVYPSPGDVAVGDLLILDATVESGVTVTGWPSGFAQQLALQGANSSSNNRFVATKLASQADTVASTWTASLSGSPAGAALLYVLRGAASATPSNIATYTVSGYTTSLLAPSLPISAVTDATVYGYGGMTSGYTGTVSAVPPSGTLSNGKVALQAGAGVAGSIGWGIDVAAPGAAVPPGTALDVLDWAMDFPALPLGVGGLVVWAWGLSGSVDNAVAMMSFGPQGVPVIKPAAMVSF